MARNPKNDSKAHTNLGKSTKLLLRRHLPPLLLSTETPREMSTPVSIRTRISIPTLILMLINSNTITIVLKFNRLHEDPACLKLAPSRRKPKSPGSCHRRPTVIANDPDPRNEMRPTIGTAPLVLLGRRSIPTTTRSLRMQCLLTGTIAIARTSTNIATIVPGCPITERTRFKEASVAQSFRRS